MARAWLGFGLGLGLGFGLSATHPLALALALTLTLTRWIDEDAALASKEEIDERRGRLLELSVGPLLDKYRGEGGADYEEDLYAESERHDEL